MVYFIIVLVSTLLDQFTKYYVHDNFYNGQSITMIESFFNVTYINNKGAAWGIFYGKTIFLVALTVVAIVFLGIYFYKNKCKNERIAISLIMGGAIGNLYDRVFRDGSVVDFLDFYIFNYNYPVFNLADVFIVCGSILLIVATINKELKLKKN